MHYIMRPGGHVARQLSVLRPMDHPYNKWDERCWWAKKKCGCLAGIISCMVAGSAVWVMDWCSMTVPIAIGWWIDMQCFSSDPTSPGCRKCLFSVMLWAIMRGTAALDGEIDEFNAFWQMIWHYSPYVYFDNADRVNSVTPVGGMGGVTRVCGNKSWHKSVVLGSYLHCQKADPEWPTLSRIADMLLAFPAKYDGNGVSVPPYAPPPPPKKIVLNHNIYVSDGCGMQSDRLYHQP